MSEDGNGAPLPPVVWIALILMVVSFIGWLVL
jgi:hypothetical protein